MRILHLLSSPWWTGPAEAVASLALAQRALGLDVTVAVDRKRTEVASEELIVPRLRRLGLLDEGGLCLSVKGSFLDTLRDARKLRQRSVDVVHCHFSHDHWVASLGRPKNAMLVRSLHAPRSARRLMPRADLWTVPYQSLADRLGDRKVTVLPALVEPAFVPPDDRMSLRKELGLEGDPVVGMVSTFKPSRRHALALEAFERLAAVKPGARLVLVGDGGLERSLRDQAGALACASKVRFEGYHSGDAFVRRLQALDVVWILGLGNDWSARAAAQARACGVRVVAVDEGALSKWADVLVEPSVDALVEATLDNARREVLPTTAIDVARSVRSLLQSG